LIFKIKHFIPELVGEVSLELVEEVSLELVGAG
jgi:hypothetical protein